MKKIFAFMLALSLLLCLTACDTPESPQPSNDPVQDSFSFTYKETKIALNAPAEAIIAALGEPSSYDESTSCAFEGLDKVYGYPSIYIQTYPLCGKDYIYGFWFVDDLVANDEGLFIGASLADVQALYGTDGYNGTDTYQIKKGSGALTILLENDVVTSIQYAILAT